MQRYNQARGAAEAAAWAAADEDEDWGQPAGDGEWVAAAAAAVAGPERGRKWAAFAEVRMRMLALMCWHEQRPVHAACWDVPTEPGPSALQEEDVAYELALPEQQPKGGGGIKRQRKQQGALLLWTCYFAHGTQTYQPMPRCREQSTGRQSSWVQEQLGAGPIFALPCA